MENINKVVKERVNHLKSSNKDFKAIMDGMFLNKNNIFAETNDGYKISEEDFKLRGQGDLFGNRQSGALSFKLSDIRKDYDLIVKVKEDVDEIY